VAYTQWIALGIDFRSSLVAWKPLLKFRPVVGQEKITSLMFVPTPNRQTSALDAAAPYVG